MYFPWKQQQHSAVSTNIPLSRHSSGCGAASTFHQKMSEFVDIRCIRPMKSDGHGRNNANGKYLKAPLNAICGRNMQLRTTNKLRICTVSGLSVKSRTFYVHSASFEWLWTDFCHGKRNLHPTPSVDETRNYIPRTPCWFRHFQVCNEVYSWLGVTSRDLNDVEQISAISSEFSSFSCHLAATTTTTYCGHGSGIGKWHPACQMKAIRCW